MSSDIWVLADYRLGNTNQAIALTKAIGLNYELKNIEYNILGKLPNFFLQTYPIHVDRNILQSLTLDQPPKIILSSGRRTAVLAIYLKRKLGNIPKIIQIMKPGISYSEFDLVILPKHDKAPRELDNIVRISGALSSLNIEKGVVDLKKNYPDIKEFIAVIIGGDSKNYKFTNDSCAVFASILTNIASNHSIPLWISFSRRTPDFMKKIIRDNFQSPHMIYDPQDGGVNPYLSMLTCADYIIATGDSISMCSEAAYSGKPFYIFSPNDFASEKHKSFIEELMKLGISRKFDESLSYLEKYQYKPLREIEKIIKMIHSKLL
jgi:mitochondrial fission protein ELM1